MAVASSAAVSPRKTTTKKRKTTQQEKGMEEHVQMKMGADDSEPRKQDSISENPKQLKRTKSPGVRVVGQRVYDSENGKTCHQCRQKTLDFAAACKNIKNDKQCTMKLCHKCLLNRYGEKAEEVAMLDDWKCPKCRGICNCSFCMKKRGCQPTGILVHTAKASGFSSVSEMLHGKDPKSIPKSKDGDVASLKKRGKENNFDGTCNTASGSQVLSREKFKKVKELTETRTNRVKNKPTEVGDVKKVKKKDLAEVTRDNKVKGSTEMCDEKDKKDITETNNGNIAKKSTEICNAKKVKKDLTEIKNTNKVKMSTQIGDVAKKAKKEELLYDLPIIPAEKPKELEITLPHGAELTNVSGVDLPSEDVGNALQFVQFCYTFGEILEIRKGQAESVLRDIMFGRNRRGKVSSLIQFQIQLLTLLRKDMGEESLLTPTDGKDCWLYALKECVTESEWAAKDLAVLSFDRTDRYDMLSSSEKLRLLVFLCDETLETLELRNWMDEQNLKFSEDKKEAKEKLHAAKEKEKLIKRKFQDEVVKAIIAKNGASLSIAEHEALVSEVKAESERARAEILETMGLIPEHKRTSDAVRIEPVYIDAKGHAYWRLKGCNKLDLLRQEIQGRGEGLFNDKWFSFEDKEIQVINEYISFPRLKRQKRSKASKPVMENGNLSPGIDFNEIPNLSSNDGCKTNAEP